ncbi:MAG: integrase core domain-containing protein [Pseudonocardiaceae bacterium]
MDDRIAVAFARRVDEQVSVTALCGQLKISRQTFYVYQRRFIAEGLVGLVPRSRAPHHQPRRTPEAMQEQILTLRKRLIDDGWDGGARSIRSALLWQGADPPSWRTIHRILVRHGRVVAQPNKRPRSSWRRFAAAQPNAVWQIDGMDWQLSDASPVVILRVEDDCSRKTVGRKVAPTESEAAAWACLQRAMAEHGRPAMLLSDNSLAFNATRRHKTLALSERLRQLGVAQVAASPHHPQTCGKTEREHQTLARWLRAQPPAATMADLEAQIAVYDEIYNGQRAHQALGETTTPDQAYAAVPKACAADSPLPPKPRATQVKVNARGIVSVANYNIQIGAQWQGVTLTAIRHGHHVALFWRDQPVHSLALDPTRRYQPSGRPAGGRRKPRVAAGAAADPRRGAGGVKMQRPQRSEDERS